MKLSTFSILLLFLISAIAIYSIVPLLPSLELKFHTSLTTLALVISLGWVGGAIGGVIIGVLSDSYGRRLMLFISVLMFGISSLLSYFITSVYLLFASWFFVGFGVNGENGISYAFIAETLKGGRGTIGGFMQGLYFAGYLLSLVLALTHFSFLIVGILALVLSPLSLTISESSRRGFKPFSNLKEINVRLATISSLLAISAFLYTVPFISLLPTLFKELHVSYSILIIASVVGIIFYALSGYISDVLGRKRTSIIFSAIATIGGILFYFLVRSFPLIVFLVLLGSSFFSYLGVWISELYPPKLRATGNNLSFLLGRIIGGGFGVTLVTLLPFSLSLNLTIILIICGLIALISSIIL